MKLWTYYYARIKDLPKNVLPVAISLSVPPRWPFPIYKKVAPSQTWFWDLKEYEGEDKEKIYIQRYNDTVLSKLTQKEVYEDLKEILDSENKKDDCHYDYIALICFEKSGDFCHRHLFSNWFSCSGFGTCEEFSMKEYKMFEYLNLVESYEKELLAFDDQENLVIGRSPKENGCYLTLRIRPDRLYTSVNYWENNSWVVQIADASIIIGFYDKRLKNLENYDKDR